MKHIRRVALCSFIAVLVTLSVSVLAYGYNMSFDLDRKNLYKKSELWYFDETTIDFGVENYKGGDSNIKLCKVREWLPDKIEAEFELTPRNSSYIERVHVTNSNAYYATVQWLKNYPSGDIIAEWR